MPPQNSDSGSPANAAQGSPSGGQSSSSTASGSTTTSSSTTAAPQTLSGTWVQAEDPQFLIQWTLTPPASGSSTYTAQVGVYQLIFDTAIPTPIVQESTVPFSLSDPAYGPTPYLQGSLTLTQTPPGLTVNNLQFPGFPAQSISLVSIPATGTTGSTAGSATTTPAGGTSSTGSGSGTSTAGAAGSSTTPASGGSGTGGSTGTA